MVHVVHATVARAARQDDGGERGQGQGTDAAVRDVHGLSPLRGWLLSRLSIRRARRARAVAQRAAAATAR